jgi:hypothetical protein
MNRHCPHALLGNSVLIANRDAARRKLETLVDLSSQLMKHCCKEHRERETAWIGTVGAQLERCITRFERRVRCPMIQSVRARSL